MKPRLSSLPVAAAFTAATVLLLSACGGGDDGADDKDKVTGASSGKASASASPSAGPSDSTQRPKITVPSDLTYDFQWPKTGDKDKDAVLNDAEQFIRARDMAIAEQDPLHKAYRFYTDGETAASTQEYVQAWVDALSRGTGRDRFYAASATVHDDGTAALTYCEDQSRAFDKSIKTGKVNHTETTKNSYVFYATKLRKNNLGVWITTFINSQRGSAQCQ